MYQCVLDWIPHQLLFINKYQQNILYQSYVYISFSLSYHKVIISHTLNILYHFNIYNFSLK